MNYRLMSRRTRFKYAIKRILNLSAYFPMDEPSGTTMSSKWVGNFTSYSGPVGSGVSVNNPAYLGRGYLFNGTSGKVLLDSVYTIKNQRYVNMLAVVAVSASAADKTIYFESTDAVISTSRLYFRVDLNNKLACGGRSDDAESFQSLLSNNALTNGVTYLVGCAIDVASDSVLLYVNGSQVATTGTIAFTASTFKNSNPLGVTVGAQNIGAAWQNFHNNLLNHLIIVTGRAMTASEFLNIAQLGGFA